MTRTIENFIEPEPLWPALRYLIDRSRELHEAAELVDPLLAGRLLHVATAAEIALRTADLNLITHDQLAALSAAISALLLNVESSTPTRLEPALAPNTDGLALAVAALPTSPNPEVEFAGLREQVDALVRRMSNAEDLHGERTSQMQRELDEQLLALSQTLSALEVAVANLDARTTDHLNAQQLAFDDANRQRSVAFDDALAAARAANAEAVKSIVDEAQEARRVELGEFDTLVERHEGRASELLSFIETKRDEVDTLVEAIGRKAVTGGYGEWEEEERKQANNYRLLALVFGVLAVVALLLGHWLLTELEAEGGQARDWAPFGVSLGLSAIAGYCGRQSSEHRSRAAVARTLAIELTSLGPFITGLTDDQQGEIRVALTHRYFGRPERLSVNQPDGPTRWHMLRQRSNGTAGDPPT